MRGGNRDVFTSFVIGVLRVVKLAEEEGLVEEGGKIKRTIRNLSFKRTLLVTY